MPAYNIKTTPKCAFCKYWYDPTYSAIKPESPKVNMWSYNNAVKKMCIKKGLDMSAGSSCGSYQCKLSEYFN